MRQKAISASEPSMIAEATWTPSEGPSSPKTVSGELATECVDRLRHIPDSAWSGDEEEKDVAGDRPKPP